jgi:hypothetical protein
MALTRDRWRNSTPCTDVRSVRRTEGADLLEE